MHKHNDLPNHQKPGVLFIGVNDDGTCANISVTDELLRTLSDMRSDGNIAPAKAVRTQDAVHSQLPLARNQSELIDDGFDSLTTTNSSQSC